MDSETWIRVPNNDSAPTSTYTDRLRVDGGYLYRTTTADETGVSLMFVPLAEGRPGLTREVCDAAIRRGLSRFDRVDELMALVALVPWEGDPMTYARAACDAFRPALEQRIAQQQARIDAADATIDRLKAETDFHMMPVADTHH